MAVRPPNAVEFGIASMPGQLTVAELAAQYGVDAAQIKAWKLELQETGTLARCPPMTRERSQVVRSIIDSCLGRILEVSEMSLKGMTPNEITRRMEACGAVLARVHPYITPEEKVIVVDEHDAWAMVEKASRSADVVLH